MKNYLSIQEFCAGLKKHFKIAVPNDFLDRTFLPLKIVSLDILLFDDLMHKRHGDYDEGNEAISLKDLVEREYGVEASKFVESAIGI